MCRYVKREVHHLGRELLQERTKVKALSEELENPLNVHRWRKLEGSDPSTYEMIQKIQTLQKRWGAVQAGSSTAPHSLSKRLVATLEPVQLPIACESALVATLEPVK